MGHDLERLKPKTRWLGQHREVLDATDSTNLRAETLAESGCADGTLVLADHQTAGRGRMGRSFFSPPGVGVYLSAVLRPGPVSPEHAPQHTFAAAVAVASAVEAVLDLEHPVEIKWPNDVLLDGRKTSGINLVVRLAPSGTLEWLVLGVGVNVNTPLEAFPDALRPIATSIAATRGTPIDRAAFVEDLLLRLEREIDDLRAHRFAAVLERWKVYFKMQNAYVKIGIGSPGTELHDPPPPAPQGDTAGLEKLEGRVVGLDAEGALVLDTPQGPRRVLAGDVTVLRREA